MTNIIGDQITNYRNKEHNENEFFFDYLKKEIKQKRKMGHLTTFLSNITQMLKSIEGNFDNPEVHELLGINISLS